MIEDSAGRFVGRYENENIGSGKDRGDAEDAHEPGLQRPGPHERGQER